MDTNESAQGNGQAAPQWALQLMQQMQAQAQRLEQMEQQIALQPQGHGGAATTPATAATPSDRTSDIGTQLPLQGSMRMGINERLADAAVVRARDKLPEAPEFEGRKVDFQPWLSQVWAKLSVDRRNEPEDVRFWYIHSRLRKKALTQMGSWVTVVQNTDNMTVDGLIRQLKLVYEDPQQKARASNKLGILKQGLRSFASYLAEFEKTVLDAGGAMWDDTVKRTFLANGLSDELHQAIVATPLPTTYNDYCLLLHSVSQNLEALQNRQKRTKGYRTRESSQGLQGNYQTQSQEGMDWEPTAISTASVHKGPRAKWVSKEVLDERRRARACIRCGSKDHFVRDCQLQAAQRPYTQEKENVRIANTQQIEPIEGSDTSNESGKE
jgi:hypothetical protein